MKLSGVYARPGAVTCADPRASWSSRPACCPYCTTLGVADASSGASAPCPVCTPQAPRSVSSGPACSALDACSGAGMPRPVRMPQAAHMRHLQPQNQSKTHSLRLARWKATLSVAHGPKWRSDGRQLPCEGWFVEHQAGSEAAPAQRAAGSVGGSRLGFAARPHHQHRARPSHRQVDLRSAVVCIIPCALSTHTLEQQASTASNLGARLHADTEPFRNIHVCSCNVAKLRVEHVHDSDSLLRMRSFAGCMAGVAAHVRRNMNLPRHAQEPEQRMIADFSALCPCGQWAGHLAGLSAGGVVGRYALVQRQEACAGAQRRIKGRRVRLLHTDMQY